MGKHAPTTRNGHHVLLCCLICFHVMFGWDLVVTGKAEGLSGGHGGSPGEMRNGEMLGKSKEGQCYS